MKPQLMLRDLFWLALVVALTLGWWIDRSKLKESANIVYEAIRTYELADLPFGSGPVVIEKPLGRYRIFIRVER